MRRAITAIVRVVARIFFRRIEIAGVERIPQTSPVIFAVNHPNALIDPLFLLCFSPRRVSVLAKAPLFKMPVVRWLVRAFDSIPVYRKQDNVSTALNRETFARAREILQRGGAIAIFPEGTTHSDPQMRELKTGAARIALGTFMQVSIVPTGLYYTAKQVFRSSALAYFGSPIEVEPEPLDQNGEPQVESVRRLTDRIDKALDQVTLQADSHAALELIARAERIFSAEQEQDLASELELRQQFVTGYAYLRERDPRRLRRLKSEIARMDAEVAPRGPVELRVLIRLLLLPLGMIGLVIHWPVYRLIRLLAIRYSSGQDEMIATVKILAGLLLYPLLWLTIVLSVDVELGTRLAVIVLLGVPLLGYIALVTVEAFDDIVARLRAGRRVDVRAQQQKVRNEILAIASEINATSKSSSSRGDSSPASPTAAADGTATAEKRSGSPGR